MTGASVSTATFAPDVIAETVLVAVCALLGAFMRNVTVPCVSAWSIVDDAAHTFPDVLTAVVDAWPNMLTVGAWRGMSEVKVSVTTSPAFASVVEALFEAIVTGFSEGETGV
jgi:hypothetical protein